MAFALGEGCFRSSYVPIKPASFRGLTVVEVADRLGASEKTVRRLVADGSLHHHRIGHLVRIAEEDFAAFIAARRR